MPQRAAILKGDTTPGGWCPGVVVPVQAVLYECVLINPASLIARFMAGETAPLLPIHPHWKFGAMTPG